jgi:leucyl aminopeptidase (aminopeptidase T)
MLNRWCIYSNKLDKRGSLSVIQTSQLMLSREIIAVCSQNHTKYINKLCEQNVELLNAKLAVHIVTTGLQSVISVIKLITKIILRHENDTLNFIF